MSDRPDAAGARERSPRWPWALLLLAAAWSILIRIPLILNAPNHLDSDLAVDGLTLLNATRGHWRWHYPGTPFIGCLSVLFSYPQAVAWGATPQVLVSGGTVAAVGLLVATFLLARRAFGPAVALWSLVPLTFASTGAVWLSGRITGGHLTAAVWHAGAFALLADWVGREDRRWNSVALGFWCGLGLAVDSMVALTLAGLLTAAVGSWAFEGWPRRGLLWAALFAAGFLSGVSPRYVGARVDPYDAYREQFTPVTDPSLLSSHGKTLALECLPRLISGHRLPGLETDPDPASISAPGTPRRREKFDAQAAFVTVLTLALASISALTLAGAVLRGRSTAARTVAFGLVVSSGAALAAFVVNRNIFNSDNYRYLVTLLVPWAVGFGLFIDGLLKKGRSGGVAVSALCVLLAVVMTADLSRWYARFGWVDGRGWPVRKPIDDPSLDWLKAHPEVTWIDGGYWDVYRLSFLTGGRLRGAPFPIYPNRFPEWRPVAGQGRATLVRSTVEGIGFRDAAIRSGLRDVHRAHGLTIYAKP